MDLLSLRYFQSVARHEHISRAAEELHVAQPSLSRTIARLESGLGVPLFDRQGRNIRLNSFGESFLRRVDRVLAELDDARRELDDATGLERGSVAVAAETLFTLTGVLADFRPRYPDVRLRLFQATADLMRHQLKAREVDLCLASQPLTDPDLRSTDIMREEVFLTVPPHHRLAGRERVKVTELAGEPLVTTRRGHWQRALADRLFTEAGVEPVITCEGNEPGVTEDLISAGVGIGLLPAVARRARTQSPIVWLSLDASDCHRTLSLVWREGAYLSAAARRFRDFTIEHLRSSNIAGSPGA